MSIFSPDGALILDRSDGDLLPWNWTDPPNRNTGTNFSHLDAAFSPDATRIVTASESRRGGLAQVWDVATGKEMLALSVNALAVLTVDCSPMGEWILTASGDARVWDARSGMMLARFGELGGRRVTTAPFNVDGRRFVTSEEGAARIYLCEVCAPLTDLLRVAERRLTREFTSEEKTQFLN